MCPGSRRSPFSEIPKVLEASAILPATRVQPSDRGCTYHPGSSPGNPHRPQDGTGGEGHKLSQAKVCKPDLAMALAGTCQPPAQRGPPHLSKHLRHKLSQKRGGVYT